MVWVLGLAISAQLKLLSWAIFAPELPVRLTETVRSALQIKFYEAGEERQI